VLDAGCGAGYVATHLAEAGYCVYGIDVVDHHIVKARRNVKTRGLEGKITVTSGDYCTIVSTLSRIIASMVYTQWKLLSMQPNPKSRQQNFSALFDQEVVSLYTSTTTSTLALNLKRSAICERLSTSMPQCWHIIVFSRVC